MINRAHQWLRFCHFLSGWYTNGHININSIFSLFCYFQTGFIISGTFLIFTRQEWGLGVLRTGAEKDEKCYKDRALSQEMGIFFFFSFFKCIRLAVC